MNTVLKWLRKVWQYLPMTRRRQSKKEGLKREVEEIERKVDESIKLDKEILATKELTSLRIVQN